MKLPTEFQINAYDPLDSAAASCPVPETTDLWALRNRPETLTFLASEEPADLREWKDPRVGWGLIVPENPNCVGKESADLADYKDDPIRQLWEARGRGPVLSYN